MKFPKFLVLLTVATLLLAACGPDGASSGYIPYQLGASTQHIRVNDRISGNGIYADTTNNRLYCQQGPDKVIQLPSDTTWNDAPSSNIEVDVEVICSMGQEKFDEFLQLFQLAQPSP